MLIRLDDDDFLENSNTAHLGDIELIIRHITVTGEQIAMKYTMVDHFEQQVHEHAKKVTSHKIQYVSPESCSKRDIENVKIRR